MSIEEGVAHPGNTENGYHGIHSCSEDVALHCILYLCLACQKYQGCCCHHDDFNGLGHRHAVYLVAYHERRTKGWEAAKYDYRQYTEQEGYHGILGAWARILDHLVDKTAVLLGLDDSLAYLFFIYRVVYQFFSYVVLHQGCHQDGDEGSRNTNQEYGTQLYSLATQQVGTDDGCRCCRYRTSGNT